MLESSIRSTILCIWIASLPSITKLIRKQWTYKLAKNKKSRVVTDKQEMAGFICIRNNLLSTKEKWILNFNSFFAIVDSPLRYPADFLLPKSNYYFFYWVKVTICLLQKMQLQPRIKSFHNLMLFYSLTQIERLDLLSCMYCLMVCSKLFDTNLFGIVFFFSLQYK